MTSTARAVTMRFAPLVLAMSASGCSLIGFVGGSGVDALRKHPPERVATSSLPVLREGSRLTLTLLDSTSVEGRLLRAQPADFDSIRSLAVLRLRLTAKGDPRFGDTLLVPVSQVASATMPGRRTAARKAAAAGAKPDVVVLKVLIALALTAALLVGIFGLILSGSGFSF